MKFNTQNIPSTKPQLVGFPSMIVVFLDTMLQILVLAYPSTKPGVHKSGHTVAPTSSIIIAADFFPLDNKNVLSVHMYPAESTRQHSGSQVTS
jgi:hypothetical protein